MDQMFRCLTEGVQEPDGTEGMTYLVELPRDIVENNSRLEDGDTYVTIPRGHALRENNRGTSAIVYPTGSNTTIETIPPTRRHLGVQERRQGQKTMLVIRVSASDSLHSLKQTDISARIFGLGEGAPVVNVVSQYKACSFGKFTIKPAAGQGITNGVTDINIGNAKGKDPFVLENVAVQIAERKLGRNLENSFDHVMICLPPGTLYLGTRSKWFAYGYLNWYRTVFNDVWCGYYS